MTLHELIDRVEDGSRRFTEEERRRCETLVEEARIMVNASRSLADEDVKNVVIVRMVRRAMGNADISIPMGASQGSMSGLGYSQSWQIASGSYGELYISKADKKLLGISNKIGMAHAFDVGD